MYIKIFIIIFLFFSQLYGITISQLDALEKLQSKNNEENLNFSQPKEESAVIKNNISQKKKTSNSIKQDKINNKLSVFKYKSNQEILKKTINNKIIIDEKELKRFGDNFFKNGNLINSNLMPMSNSYQISIGDSISVWLYGKKNINSIFQVDKNGFIHIKNIGSIYVYNLRFDKLKELLTNKFKRIYKNIKVHINLQKTVPIQITIAGEVNSPGIYNIPSFSTIVSISKPFITSNLSFTPTNTIPFGNKALNNCFITSILFDTV
jgi:hypothetical protein